MLLILAAVESKAAIIYGAATNISKVFQGGGWLLNNIPASAITNAVTNAVSAMTATNRPDGTNLNSLVTPAQLAAATNGAAYLAANQTFTGNNTFNSAITFQTSLTAPLISDGAPIMFVLPTGGGSFGFGYDAGVNLQNGGNVAMGSFSLKTSNNGIGNTGIGYNALSLLSGTSAASYSTGIGYGALQNGTVESMEIAIGKNSLINDNGSNNVAIGNLSLSSTTNAVNNIAIGYQSAINYANSESNNIDIGNSGISKENGTIHIGTPGTQTNLFIAGITNTTAANFSGTPSLMAIDAKGLVGILTQGLTRTYSTNVTLVAATSLLVNFSPPFADTSYIITAPNDLVGVTASPTTSSNFTLTFTSATLTSTTIQGAVIHE